MLMPFNQLQQAPQKVDICFYNALVYHVNNYKCEIGFYVFRALIVGGYLISHLMITETDDTNVYSLVTALFLILVVLNVANLWFSYWTFTNFYANSIMINEIAQRIQHSRMIDESNPQQILTYYSPYPSISLLVSRTDFQFESNILTTDVDDLYKRRAEKSCAALIAQQVSSNQGIRFWTQFFNLTSISIFTYTIVLLSQGKGITEVEAVFLICYLFSEICSRFFIYLILMVIGLSPLCCFGFCIYACFFKKQKKVQLPPTQQATLQIVKDCEGNCPICYQSVNLKESVIVLKCSQKHIFHDICIRGWTSLGKDTCPVCRAEI